MRMHLIGGLAAATLLMSFTPDAEARPFRPGLLPNGDVNNCANCHVSAAGGGPRTSFGEQVRANVSVGGTEFFWTAICDLDADGDGQTNGEELGDPCCLWDDTSDGFLRMVEISHPGDENDMSVDPAGPDADGDGISNACDPDFVPDPDMGMGGEDMGTTGDDMGVPADDMGATGDDMGAANNTPGNNTPGNNTPGNNDSPDTGSTGSDMGGAGLDEPDDGGCGCTSAPTSTATPWLLALAFVFGRVRRRRR